MPTSSSTCGKVDPLHAAGVAAHGAGVGLVEANGHAMLGRDDDFVPLCGDGDVDQLVILRSLMAMMPPLSGRLYCIERRLFHQPTRAWPSSGNGPAGEIAHGAAVGDLFAFGKVQQVDHRPAAAFAR